MGNQLQRLTLAIIILLLTACGGQVASPPPNTYTMSVPLDGGLAFNPPRLTIAANTPTTLTIKNTGKYEYSWVLVRGGQAVARKIVALGQQAGPPYVPANNPQVIASTGILKPGQQVHVQVTVLAGSYTYLSTFPGHFEAGMTGELHAQ